METRSGKGGPVKSVKPRLGAATQLQMRLLSGHTVPDSLNASLAATTLGRANASEQGKTYPPLPPSVAGHAYGTREQVPGSRFNHGIR